MKEKDNRHTPFDDDFDLSIRQKLEGHRFSVEDDWGEMEQLIKEARLRKRRIRLTWLSSAAAVLLAVVFLLPFTSVEEDFVLQEIPQQAPVLVPIPEESDIDKQENVVEQLLAKSRNVMKKEWFPEVETGVSEEEYVDVEPEDEPEVITYVKKKADKGKEELLLANVYDTPLIARKNKSRWQLGVGAFTGGTVDMGMGDMDGMLNSDGGYWNGSDPPPDEEGSTKAGHSGIQQMLDQEDYYNTNHSVPFSIGITARKELAHRLAIETGLVYTYLSSEFSKTGSANSYACTRQHYIGIPLNLVWKAAEKNNWSFYLSGGVMVEKGIRIHLLKRIWTKEGYRETTTSSGISGVQVSLQFVPGISYAFTKDWSLYVEPRFSCYFNNNQPTSIRTENTCIIGIGGGFRYTF